MSILSRMNPQQVRFQLESTDKSRKTIESTPNESRSFFETIFSEDVYQDIAANILDRLPDPNDLLALVRCCSNLHDRVIPRIYNHFNIIWDTTANAEDRCVLTLGVCTLAKFRQSRRTNPRLCYGKGALHIPNERDGTRWRNTYAAHVRKFSIANGPEDIAKKYLISNICGQQLSALVATAVAHMRHLECFAWDLPTGIAVETWNALSSLADPNEGFPAPLGKIWIRLPQTVQAEQLSSVQPHTTNVRTLSLLGPLQSLSVLDIDGAFCLDELACLIQKSWKILRELRIGISPHARETLTHDALELLFSGAWQMHSQQRKTSFDKRHLRRERSIKSRAVTHSVEAMHLLEEAQEKEARRSVTHGQNGKVKHPYRKEDIHHGLRLGTLELEHIHISARVLRRAIDWTKLTQLTLLDCTSTERLWKCLCGPPGTMNRSCSGFNLKKIHVDELPCALVRFLSGTLKRNSLEIFFLRKRLQIPTSSAEGNVEGTLWSHRLSLMKIIVERPFSSKDLDLFNKRNMPALRELAFHLEYRDWDPFCYKLPHLAHLDAVSVLDFHEPVHGWLVAPRNIANEFARMIAWRIAWKPEIGLSYISIGNHCFQFRDRANVIGDEAVDEDHCHPMLKSVAQRNWIRHKAQCPIEVREIYFYDRIEIFRARHARLTFSPTVDV